MIAAISSLLWPAPAGVESAIGDVARALYPERALIPRVSAQQQFMAVVEALRDQGLSLHVALLLAGRMCSAGIVPTVHA